MLTTPQIVAMSMSDFTVVFFFSSRRRHTILQGDWSSDVCSSDLAIVVSRDSGFYEPEMLKDKPIAVTPNNGSELTTLKMMEGFLAPEPVKRVLDGSMSKTTQAVRDGQIAG